MFGPKLVGSPYVSHLSTVSDTIAQRESCTSRQRRLSLDAGNNVIARVLDGSGDVAPTSINSHESEAVTFSVEIPTTAKTNLSSEEIRNQQILCTSSFDRTAETLFKRCSDTNMVHSTANDSDIGLNDKVVGLSKENISNSDSGELDLTQKKSENTLSSSFDHIFHTTDNKDRKTLVFEIFNIY